jgi:hypothetical protein
MSKPLTMTNKIMQSIITEINEEITAVTPSTIDHVITIVQDSIDEECTWYGSIVTSEDIEAAIEEWIGENYEAPAVEVEVEAPAARIVEDVDATTMTTASTTPSMPSTSPSPVANRHAQLIEDAKDLGCSRYAISEVIGEARTRTGHQVIRERGDMTMYSNYEFTDARARRDESRRHQRRPPVLLRAMSEVRCDVCTGVCGGMTRQPLSGLWSPWGITRKTISG